MARRAVRAAPFGVRRLDAAFVPVVARGACLPAGGGTRGLFGIVSGSCDSLTGFTGFTGWKGGRPRLPAIALAKAGAVGESDHPWMRNSPHFFADQSARCVTSTRWKPNWVFTGPCTTPMGALNTT